MNKLKLNNGLEIPALGFGTYLISNPEVCKLSVAAALNAGYRLIDTASMYLSETAVGEGIRLSGIPRDEIFVTTKIWLQDCSYDKVKSALDRSLKRMGLDYVDMYMIHWPFGDNAGTWKAMEEAVAEGKIRSLGVSNFSIEDLEELKKTASIMPVVNQVECHPISQQRELRTYLQENNILLEAWGVLGRAKAETMENSVIQALAEKYNKSVAQIMLRWTFQEGMVGIPKSTSIERIVNNNRIWDFVLSDEDINQIRSVDTGKKIVGRGDSNDPAYRERLLNMVFDI